MKGSIPGAARRAQRSMARSGIDPAHILAGRIVDVDPVQWTCLVRTELYAKVFRDVSIGSLYVHPMDGEGVHVMPEVGAPVWVGISSEGDLRPFIVGYRPYFQRDSTSTTYPNKIGARSNRPTMTPGDIFLQTRDRNGLRLRRGGVTEIFASPLARTVYQAREGTIYSLCKNHKLDVVSGATRWLTAPAEQDDEGKQATTFMGRVKEFSSHKGHVVQLDAGGALEIPAEGATDGESGVYGAAPQSAELVSAPVLRLRVFQDGDQWEDDLQEAVSLAMDKEGQVELAQKGALHVEIRGSSNVTLKLSPDGKVSLEADSDVDVVTSGNYTQKAGTAALQMKNDGSTVAVGVPLAKVLFDLQFSPMLAASLLELSMGLKALGMPTTATDAMFSALQTQTFTASKLETQ